MESKYLKTVLLFKELPTPPINEHDGYCKLAIEPYRRLRPCSLYGTLGLTVACDKCIFYRKTQLNLLGDNHAK